MKITSKLKSEIDPKLKSKLKSEIDPKLKNFKLLHKRVVRSVAFFYFIQQNIQFF